VKGKSLPDRKCDFMTESQPKPQNKFAALDQKVSDSRANEKLQAQQQVPNKADNDQSKKTGPQPGTKPSKT